MILKRFVKGIDEEAVLPEARARPSGPTGSRSRSCEYASGDVGRGGRPCATPPALAWVVNLGCVDLNPHPVRAEDLDHPDELRIDLDPVPGVDWEQIVDVALVAREVLEDHGLIAWPKTSGSRGFHIYARIEPHWPFSQVRLRRRGGRPRGRTPRARPGHQPVVEGGTPRRLRRLQPERQGPHRRVGVLGAPDPDARVSTPLPGTRCPTAARARSRSPPCLDRFAELGDPWEGIDDAAGSPGRAAGPGRAARARPRSRPKGGPAAQSTMPLIEIARAKTKDEALDGLSAGRPATRGGRLLEPADVLVDGMRGRSSLWYRIRVNLQHVPEEQRRRRSRSRSTTTPGPAARGRAAHPPPR